MSEIDSKQIYTDLGLNKTPVKDDRSNEELGQAEFLELMTAQLQYQDPLEPMENGDFIAQMAQFGTVDGIGKLNTSFDEMSTSFQSNQALQASTMVGRNVLVQGNQLQLEEGKSVQMAVDLQAPASDVVVNISDSRGQLVHRISLGSQQAGFLDIQWNGLDQNGNRMAPGSYSIEAEVRHGDTVSAGETLISAQVESVTLGNAGQDLTLTVSGVGDISLSQVRKIM